MRPHTLQQKRMQSHSHKAAGACRLAGVGLHVEKADDLELGCVTSDRRVMQLQSWLTDDKAIGVKLMELVPDCIFTLCHNSDRLQWKFLYDTTRFTQLYNLAYDMVEGHLSPKSALKKRKDIDAKVQDTVECPDCEGDMQWVDEDPEHGRQDKWWCKNCQEYWDNENDAEMMETARKKAKMKAAYETTHDERVEAEKDILKARIKELEDQKAKLALLLEKPAVKPTPPPAKPEVAPLPLDYKTKKAVSPHQDVDEAQFYYYS